MRLGQVVGNVVATCKNHRLEGAKLLLVQLVTAEGTSIATPTIAIDAAQGFSFGARWFALAQAHGHLQSVGFVGLFVIGVSFRLVPRFAGRPAPSSLIVAATLLLVALGVIARAIGQPLSDKAGFDWLMATGGWLELGGALLFAAVILRTLAPALRGTQGWALFFALGAIGFAVQAALGAWWLEDAVLDDRTLISSSRDQLLLSLQFFAMHLPFVLGVGLRAWPTFFGRGAAPFPAALVVALALLLANLGLVVAHFIGSSSGTREWELEDASIVLLSAGLIGLVLTRSGNRQSDDGRGDRPQQRNQHNLRIDPLPSCFARLSSGCYPCARQKQHAPRYLTRTAQ